MAMNAILGANSVVAMLPPILFGTSKQQPNVDEEYAILSNCKPNNVQSYRFM